MAREEYEAWEDDEGVILSLSVAFRDLDKNSSIGGNPHFLHSIVADTPEEASAVHHIKMGWEPYIPMGKATLCPRECESYYYPEGSGQCPKCGVIC